MYFFVEKLNKSCKQVPINCLPWNSVIRSKDVKSSSRETAKIINKDMQQKLKERAVET